MEPAVQKPLRHSETPITFSREDQWTSFSEPGKFPLVLDPVVAGSILTWVLIDGGSGLNLIFMSTITKMGLDISDKLKPSKAPFYSIVPRNASFSVGTVVLPVTFGTPDNYRTELIKFEVADFESSYHAILGRPALAKFMAIPHGSEAILPADIMWKSPRLEMYDSAEADGSRQLELDSLNEMRCNALL